MTAKFSILPKLLLSAGLLLFIAGRLPAQILERQVTATIGHTAGQAGIQVDYTIGEAVTMPVTASGILLTQGFQQPFTYILSSDAVFPYLVIYPNPTYGNTIAHFALPADGKLHIAVFNAIGQRVLYETAGFQQGETQYVISTASLVAGTYFVVLSLEGYGTVSKKLLKVNR